MADLSIKDLIEAGVHFGHKSSRWNPKMKPYIFGKRNAIHIIDLKTTLRGILQARDYLIKAVARGEQILFVGTKKAAKLVVKEEAERAGMPFAAERWLGGTFTNFETIKSRVQRLDSLEDLETTGKINLYSKKVISRYGRQKRKLNRNLGGIRKMGRIPDCMVVVDPRREKAAVAEARRLNIPVIGLIDTDSDPEEVDIAIPGNDDALRSIKCVVAALADAVIEGKKRQPPQPVRGQNPVPQKQGGGGGKDRHKERYNEGRPNEARPAGKEKTEAVATPKPAEAAAPATETPAS